MEAIFQIISTPLGWLMKLIYDTVNNYALTLLLFTITTKVILFYFSLKQQKSSTRQAALQPMLDEIKSKYTDPRQQNEEIAKFYQDNNISMLAGCLPMVIQLPVMFGLIYVIYGPLQYIMGISKDIIERAKPIAEHAITAAGGTMSRYSPQINIIDQVKKAPELFTSVFSAENIEKIQNFNMSFFGLNLGDTPTFGFNLLVIIPIVTVATMLLSQYVTQKFSGIDTANQPGALKYMTPIMAVMFGFFTFQMPAGVSLYWIFSQVLTIPQAYILKLIYDPAKVKAQVKQEIADRKKRNRGKPVTANGAPAPGDAKAPSKVDALTAQKRLELARKLDDDMYNS